jgi:hypothetical protein
MITRQLSKPAKEICKLCSIISELEKPKSFNTSMYVKNAGLSRLPTCSYPKGDLKKRKGKGTQVDMVFS